MNSDAIEASIHSDEMNSPDLPIWMKTMTSKTLEITEALLLQRYHDGDASREEIEAAEALLSSRAAARIFVEVLSEVGEGVRIAHGEALKRVEFAPAEAVVERALAWAGYAEASLDELAPLLERFHDGEVDPTEAVVVQTLLESREDVAEYLMELSSMAAGIQNLVGERSEVDFGGLWAGIEAAISEEDKGALDPYRPQEHGLLLQRFHDGEVDEAEARRVQNWLREDDGAVDGMLGAMAELHIAVNAGLESAQEEVDFGEVWTGIEAQLDRIDAEKETPKVVSLQARREEAAGGRRQQSGPSYLAIAAMALLVVLAGVVATQVMPSEKVVETRTVVIFESVEYAPGSSVMIHSPELASHGGEEGEEELPILWVIEDEEEYRDGEDVEENEALQEEDPRFLGPF